MLTKNQKKELIEKITEKIADSDSMVICDYKGLTVAEMSELRRKLKAEGVAMKVLKKTILQIALKEAGIEMDIKNLEGQIALIYGGEDEVTSSRLAHQFSQTHESFRLLKGILEKKELAEQEVVALAKLPSKEELLAKVVGSIKAPVSGLVGVLQGNLRNLVGVLNAIKEVKN